MKKFINKILGRRPPPFEGLLPKKDVSVFLDGKDYTLQLLEPRMSDGNVSAYELFVINSLVKQNSPGVIFEIGTFNGRTTLNMAANSRTDSRIFTLDLPKHGLSSAQFELAQIEKKYVEKDISGERFHNRPEAAKITQLYGDSATFDFAPYFGKTDFVFVDASHAYEYVLNDSKIAIKLLAGGRGVILWHDYGRPAWWPGVVRALDELQKNSPEFASLTQIEGTSLVCLVKK